MASPKETPDEYGSKSIFNEAGYYVRRLHDLQKQTNEVRNNLLAWNNENNCYNYDIYFNNLCSLLIEIWSKLNDDQKKEMNDIRLIIKKTLTTLPPYKKVYKAHINKNELVFERSNWDILSELLFVMETHIKDHMEEYGLSNPDAEGDDLF